MEGNHKYEDLLKNIPMGWANSHEDLGSSIMPPDFGFDSLPDSAIGEWVGSQEPFSLTRIGQWKNVIKEVGVDAFRKTYPTWASNHYQKPPRDLDDVRLRVRQGGIGGSKPLKDVEKEWCNLYMQTYGQVVFSKTYDDHASKEQFLHPTRKRIVDKALSMNGSIISERPNGETRKMAGRNVKTNVGGDLLVQIFETIAPHKLTGQTKKTYKENQPLEQKNKNYKEAKKSFIMDSRVKTAGNTGRESWCGIFAFWVQYQAGNGKTMWEPSLSVSDEKHNFLSPEEEPKPGDICYSPEHNQHYATIIGVEGNNIISIDGNSAPSSGIWLQTRSKSYWQHYIRALPKGEDLNYG